MEGSIAPAMVEEPLRIHQLVVRNYKRLKTVVITPDPDQRVLVLTGKNRQGKTSLIETIWVCLLGEKYIPPQPIREGEESAEASIDFGEFVVTRTITPKTTKLTVKAKDGFTAPSPQTFLSSKLSDMIQNPLDFMRLKPDQQVKVLQGLVELKLDLEEWNRVSGLPLKEIPADPIAVFDEAHAYLYKERGKINQEVERLAGVVKSFTPPENWEVIQPVSVKELFEERKALESKARDNELAFKRVQSLEDRVGDLVNEKQNLEVSIRSLELQLSDLREKLLSKTTEIDESLEALSKEKAMVDVLIDPSFEEIDARIATADETNILAAKIEDWKKATEEHRSARARSINYSERMAALKDYKGRLIAAAGMPVPDLGFENGLVTYKGFPLSQASGAEQIEVSCAVCMASHPQIGLLTLDAGWAELDKESQSVLRKWAEKVGAHIFVVQVSEEPQEEGWHFEDGEVTFINGEPAPPPKLPETKIRNRAPLKNQESMEFEPGSVAAETGGAGMPEWAAPVQPETKPPRLVQPKGA